mmetsp:Transcript_18233/g.32229  ORF Transcript_18233/g.32229 Transcript_18233/m.32229 type:complete len:542 (+) Transcript_18233:1550-3175(+)
MIARKHCECKHFSLDKSYWCSVVHGLAHLAHAQSNTRVLPRGWQASHIRHFLPIDLVLLFVLVELALLLCGGVLVLLVLGNKVVHVGLSLSEFHLIHTLASVPVKECLTAEHSSKLLTDTLEHLLDSGGVSDKCARHLESLGRDVTHRRLDVVGDPLNKVARVLVLYVKHLLVNLLGGHASTEEERSSEVASVTGVSSAHHVLRVECLLGELGHGECTVLLGSTRSEGRKANHEEVKTGERNQVHSELAQVRVELTREAQAARAARHSSANQVVKVTIGGGGELEGTEADIVESLVIENHDLICVLHKLVHGEGGVVGLHDGVRHLGRGYDREGKHDTVGVLLADLADKKGSHTGSGTTTERVGDLESLKAVAALCFLADYVEYRVDELSSLSVMSLGPVVTSSGLSKYKVVGAKELSKGSCAYRVHGSGLEIHQDRAGHVASAGCLVKVYVDALQLEVRVAMVRTGGVDSVLVRDNLPELGTNLVTTLATLNVNDLAHLDCCFIYRLRRFLSTRTARTTTSEIRHETGTAAADDARRWGC